MEDDDFMDNSEGYFERDIKPVYFANTVIWWLPPSVYVNTPAWDEMNERIRIICNCVKKMKLTMYYARDSEP
ncbi:MAG: hypothetical protein EOO38_00160 [Cytophagaceae bacterium]|nr:MAG: hypothetical protein EOO38_00160 [Cytophagaceae bacterium]